MMRDRADGAHGAHGAGGSRSPSAPSALSALCALLLLLPSIAAAQRPIPQPQQNEKQRQAQIAGLVSDGLDLERDERYDESAETYRAALRMDPTNPSALLGLERVLKASKQLTTILPQLGRALGRDPRNPLLHAVEVRVWVFLGPADSVA